MVVLFIGFWRNARQKTRRRQRKRRRPKNLVRRTLLLLNVLLVLSSSSCKSFVLLFSVSIAWISLFLKSFPSIFTVSIASDLSFSFPYFGCTKWQGRFQKVVQRKLSWQQIYFSCKIKSFNNLFDFWRNVSKLQYLVLSWWIEDK